MSAINISTYGSLQTLLQNMNHVQNELNNAQVQISSGQKSQTFDGINGSVEQLTALNAQISRLQNYQQNNASIVSGQQTANTALGQVITIANSVKSAIAGFGPSSTTASGIASFQNNLKQLRTQLISTLNTTYGGNYIFGGTDTSSAPVKDTVSESIDTGKPDNAYYQGSAQNSTLRISDGQQITNNIRADDSAFQSLFAGISQALQASGSGTIPANAENLIDTGIQGSIALQAVANSNIITVNQATAQGQTMLTYFQGLTDNLTKSDVVALTTQVAQNQTVLQASYATFARISSLTLANYLK